MRKLELLAPAKNLACGVAAIDHGADAVYIGAMHHGARAAAGNSVEDIAALCQYAHLFGVRVYVTVNTIVYDHELEETRQLVQALDKAGVDALIVQDTALLTMAKHMELHASTQMDTRTAEKAQWLHQCGCQRVVLAREMSIEEVRKLHHKAPEVELEVFVHGALCVSLSGLCYASQATMGRSANRGACSQMCRMAYDLVDAQGRVWSKQRHLLSMRDLCMLDHLEQMADAGATSFKIEGRLKDVSYVKNVVAAYSERLNALVKRRPNDYQRASKGRVSLAFTPDVQRSFTRGFTTYFAHGRQTNIASIDTPKALGQMVGTVKEIRRDCLVVASTTAFANGDGLCFFLPSKGGKGEGAALVGFRVNRAEGNRLYPHQLPKQLTVGTRLYRNHDEAFERILSGKSAERKLPIVIRMGRNEEQLWIEANQCRVETEWELQPAQQPQENNMRKQLGKLGNTPYELKELVMENGVQDYFVPSSILAELRRQLVDQLQRRAQSDATDARRPAAQVALPTSVRIPQAQVWQTAYKRYPYLYNVANHQAQQFYDTHGLHGLSPAFECQPSTEGTDGTMGALVMQCRHCIRFTLGHCVRHGGTRPQWQEPLSLVLADGTRFRLEFQCNECQMNVYTEPREHKQKIQEVRPGK